MTAVDHNIAAARRVCEAWNVMELEEFRELFDPEVDYRNIPIEGDRHIGPDAAHDVLSRFKAKWDAELEVHNITGTGDVVMTERTEHFSHRAGTKDNFDLPVMGVFEFRDGKITAWRDYFELSHLRLRG